MENEKQVDEATNSSEEVTSETVTTEETVETPKTYTEAEFKQAIARAKKAEAEAKVNKAKADAAQKSATKSLDVEDYIGISASLEGLDAREKEYLAKQHKMTGTPLNEIRKSEDFIFWQSSYRQKAEKERASLTPSTKQPDDDSPISLEDALASAKTVEEKEEILKQVGYSIGKQSSAVRVKLG